MEVIPHNESIISLLLLRSDSEEILVDGSVDLFTIIRTLAPLDLVVGSVHYSIPANKLLFIGPGIAIKVIQATSEAGYRITFPDSFFDRSSKDAEILYSRLFFDYNTKMQVVNAIRPPEEVRHVLDVRAPLFARKSKALYDAAMKNHIESLLLEGLLGLPEVPDAYPTDQLSDRNLVNSFIVMLHRCYKKEHTVHFYANALHVTPRKLSRACQATYEQTAKEIILETLGKRAVNFIQSSTLSISQIAFELGFTDESNFRRFLKKQTGKTALSFRTP
ncbi:helix-turn-helix transcriptional regulator [Sphingobacterium griseoflavum]|nr:helix-turn-helix transcriptional regulator [Sphingobacterium griseoflavum]